jgi:type I restriction enzyme, S subunit
LSIITPRNGYKFVPWYFGKEIEIPEEWEIKKFHEICSVPNGQVDPKKQPFSDMKHIGQKNIEKNSGVLLECFTAKEEGQISGKYLFNERHILYGKINPAFAKVAFPKFSGICSADMYPIDCKEGKIIPKFLFYCLLSTAFIHYAISVSDRTGIPKINRNELDNAKFIIPDVEEQQKIITIISNVDNLIETTKQAIENIKRVKKGLMQKLLTRGIGHTKFKKVNFHFGKIIEIPEDWEVRKLKELVLKINSGVTPKGGSSVYLENGIPLIRSQNVHFEGLTLDNVAFISEEIHNKMKNSKLMDNDILLNITGASIGRCTYVPPNFGEGNVNQHVCIIRVKPLLLHTFLSYVLSSNLLQTIIQSSQVGLSREGLNFKEIGNFVFPLPSLSEQNKISTILSNIDSKITSQEQYKEKLEKLKKSLMQKLLTGEVRVKV